MNGIYTIEELGLGRTKDEHIQAVYNSLIDEDIVLCGATQISSDMILDNLSREFKRLLVSQVLDSQNPASSNVRSVIDEKLLTAATDAVNGVEQPF